MSGQLSPARAIRLVARREIATRVRSKAFVLSTVVMLAVIGGYVALMVVLGASQARSTIGVTPQTSPISQQIETSARALGQTVEVSRVPDAEAGQRQVRAGELDVLLAGTPDDLEAVVEDNLDAGLRAVLDSVARAHALDAELRRAGLDPAEARRALAGAAVEVRSIEPSDPHRGARLAVALVAAGMLYFSLIFFGVAVAQGVVEEKSSRVIELLLAAVRPWQLLAGKAAGIGLTGLLQLAIFAAVGTAASIGTGVLDAPALRRALLGTVGWALLWYLLGYFLFAVLYAAAGSLVSRQEDINPVVQPLIFLALAPFLVVAAVLPSNPDSAVVEVMSLIPPFSPILMPARLALGLVPAWQAALSVLLAIAATVAMVRVAGRIYARGVLHTGGRLSLRRALGTR